MRSVSNFYGIDRPRWPGGPAGPPELAALISASSTVVSGRARSPRVRSHCRFRNRSTEYVRESGVEWMSGSTKRQCDRALRSPRMHLRNMACSARNMSSRSYGSSTPGVDNSRSTRGGGASVAIGDFHQIACKRKWEAGRNHQAEGPRVGRKGDARGPGGPPEPPELASLLGTLHRHLVRRPKARRAPNPVRSEKGVRLAQKMQVDPCILVGIQL
jgi:hypothetical protein